MLGPIGMQELIIIFVIALIVFGPRKLPELGKSLGRSIAEFKRASNELRSTLEDEIRVEETRKEIMEPIETIAREAKDAGEALKPTKEVTAEATGSSDEAGNSVPESAGLAPHEPDATSPESDPSAKEGAETPQETKV